MHNLAIFCTALLGMTQAVSAACTNPTQRKAWYVEMWTLLQIHQPTRSETHVLTHAPRSKLTDAEKSEYLNATLCLMDPVQSPSISHYAGSKTIWDDLQVAHVAQVQYIHSVVRLFGPAGVPTTRLRVVDQGVLFISREHSCRGIGGSHWSTTTFFAISAATPDQYREY
jgi:hypothetical protein